MLRKLIRKEYYDKDFPLNEQEFKGKYPLFGYSVLILPQEFSFVRIDPFWKIRFYCYSMGLNILGDKALLLRRINDHIFQNESAKKPAIDPEAFDIDIEVLIKNLKFSSGKFDNLTVQQLEARLKKGHKLDEKTTRYIWPWDVVVELTKINKRLTYADLYKGVTTLMRPTMVFYNHFLENDTLTAIVLMPFTPKNLEYYDALQLYCLNRVLEMKVNYDSLLNPADLYKQKLLDLFYFVEDCEKLHGVTFCQSHIKCCNNLATQFCPNNMCKLCCQDLQVKSPCVMHDSYEQFFRYKVQALYNFEEEMNFDITRTLRLMTRRTIKKIDLEKIFANLTVNWDKLAVFYHPSTQSINFLYMEFQDHQKAESVFRERRSYELKLEPFDLCIQTLNENLLKKAKQFPSPQNVVCIIKPLTTLEITDEIPGAEEYLSKVSTLMESITQLKKQDILIQEDVNPITKEPNDRHLFLTFPDKSYVDKVYHSQPFFGCLLVHKMMHRIICPFLRYSTEICLMCSNTRNKKCSLDLCSECCVRQKYKFFDCSCSFTFQQPKENFQVKKEPNNETINKNEREYNQICVVCKDYFEHGCPNKMCNSCCNVQCRKVKCKVHEESIFSRNLRKNSPELMARKIITLVAECHIKIRNELKNGHYDWFRPVYGTNIQEAMISANKDLQTVIDNSSIVRGMNTGKFKKEGKIFTFQANEPIISWISNTEKVYESIDHKGEAYNDYYFGEEACNEPHKIWIKNNPNKYRTYTIEEYEQYINAPNLQIRNNFHLMLIGLDKSLTVKELYQEVYSKIKSNVGNVEMKNIFIIDNESLLTDVFSSQMYISPKTMDENLHKIGRVVCVKFDNILDALALFTNDIKLYLPLNNGKIENPLIYPSKYLMKFIDEFNPQNPPNNLSTSGIAFVKLNEEIDHLNANIRNVLSKGKSNSKAPGGQKKAGGGMNNSFKGSREEPAPTKKVKK